MKPHPVALVTGLADVKAMCKARVDEGIDDDDGAEWATGPMAREAATTPAQQGACVSEVKATLKTKDSDESMSMRGREASVECDLRCGTHARWAVDWLLGVKATLRANAGEDIDDGDEAEREPAGR